MRCFYLFTFLGCLLYSHVSFSQVPVANFSTNVVSGCAPVIVKFTDISTNNPTSWNWDLGNGSIATIKNPVSTYVNPGVYTVKLTATNNSGSGTVTKTNFITIYALPAAEFSSPDTNGCAPSTVRFQDISTPGSGTVTQWEWNFGNGATSTIQNPVYLYNTSGVYGISLKVTNSFNCSKTISKTAYIKVGLPISPDFTFDVQPGCNLPASVNFTNQTQGQNLQHTWRFGNGQTSTLQDPVATFATAGNYTVWLTTRSAAGCIDSTSKIISISQKITSFSGPDSLCLGAQANFQANSSPAPQSVQWKMGDGNVYNSTAVNHTYSAPGNYTVTLINDFGGCIDSVKKVVSIKALPVADFSVPVAAACKVPLIVTFNNLSTGGVQWLWNFGNGMTSTLKNPMHTYTAFGNYDVRLSVVNASGCTTIINKPSFINIVKPVISVTNAQVAECLPYTFTPMYTVASNETITSYKWNFGDGGISALPNPSHTYTVQGNYTLSVVITTASGCKDSLVLPAVIKVGEPINLDFTPTPSQACASDLIHFQPFTNNIPVQSYAWDFGDMSVSTSQDPTHRYRDTGSFSVTLDVVNNGCKSTVTKPLIVKIEGAVSAFTFTRNCNLQGEIIFTNISINADSVRWDFGDGSTSNVINPVHNYAIAGNYPVSLIAVNGACADTFYQTVPIWFGSISANTPTPVICKNDRIFFNLIHPSPANMVNYFYNFSGNIADGFVLSGLAQVAINYNQTGNFGFIGITQDEFGCKDTITIPQMVRSNGPTVNFGSNATGGCIGTQITFFDSSVTDGVNALQQWTWDFGDGTIQTFSAPPFNHIYPNPGLYTVKLIVTDQSGCSDSLTSSDLIKIVLAKAIFSTADTMTCLGKNVTFSNQSLGDNLMHSWNFGDGNSSTSTNPTHQFQTNGKFPIRLIVSAPGCNDTLMKLQYIKVDMPRAGFVATDTISNCPPIQIGFTDTSNYAENWLWSFGDGNSSSGKSPSNLFITPGSYRVKLTVTSPGGCVDTTSKIIKVNGPSGTFNYNPTIGCDPFQVNFSVQSTSAINFNWDFGDGVNTTTSSSTTTHNYLSGGKFLPTVFIGDANGCFIPVFGTDTITTEKLLIDFDADTLTHCENGRVSFTNRSRAFGDISYTWHFGDGFTSAVINPVHTYATVGSYHVKLIAFSPLGCSDSLTKTAFVKIVKNPSVSIVADSLACFGDIKFMANLAPDTSAIISWSWNFGNGQSSILRQPPAQNFSSGSYVNTLKVINSSGCTDSISKTLQAFSFPVLQITRDTTICQGSSLNLSVSGALSYTWLPPSSASLSCTNCANPIATPVNNTKYKVVASNQGCNIEDSITIKLFLKPAFSIIADQTICAGNSVPLNAMGTQRFMWSPSAGLSQVSIANPVASPSGTTIYKAIGFDTLGCFVDSGFVAVTVVPLPTVELGPDVFINAGTPHTFQPTYSADVNTYNWSPATHLSCTNCRNPISTARDNLTYTVQVRNAGGCFNSDTVRVIVACDGTSVYIPNTFSPNGDGMNDVFFPRGKGIYRVQSMLIFNRWGLPVFEKRDLLPNDPNTAWNGTYKGSKQPAGIYTYVLEIVCSSNQVLKYYGTIQLIQ